jgi:hypothetical protein
LREFYESLHIFNEGIRQQLEIFAPVPPLLESQSFPVLIQQLQEQLKFQEGACISGKGTFTI